MAAEHLETARGHEDVTQHLHGEGEQVVLLGDHGRRVLHIGGDGDLADPLAARARLQPEALGAQRRKTASLDVHGPALVHHPGVDRVAVLAEGEAHDVDPARRQAHADRREVFGHVHVVGEVPERIVEVDHAVEVGSQLVGRPAHVAHQHLCAALRQPLGREGDRAFLEVGSRDLGARLEEMGQPQSRSAGRIKHAPRLSAEVPPHDAIDRSAYLLGGAEEGGVELAALVEGVHGRRSLARSPPCIRGPLVGGAATRSRGPLHWVLSGPVARQRPVNPRAHAPSLRAGGHPPIVSRHVATPRLESGFFRRSCGPSHTDKPRRGRQGRVRRRAPRRGELPEVRQALRGLRPRRRCPARGSPRSSRRS